MASSLNLTFTGDDLAATLQSLDSLGQAGLATWLALSAAPFAALPPTLQAVGGLRSLLPDLQKVHHALCHYRLSAQSLETLTLPPLPSSWLPVILGAPTAGQFVAFRTLFTQTHPAALWSVFRQDRHPTLPLPEADLGYWLQQLAPERSLYEINALYLEAGIAAVQERLSVIQSDPEPTTVLFDTLTSAHLAQIAQVLWLQKPALVLGSSELLEALAALLPARVMIAPKIPPVDQLLVVCGSASPTTREQIDGARDAGYFCHTFRDEARAIRVMGSALAVGHSAVIYTAQAGQSELLGWTLSRLLENSTVSRLVLCGSDTFLSIAAALHLQALEFLAPLEPGVPLCRAIGGVLDGRELVVKPGASGGRNLFQQVKQGR